MYCENCGNKINEAVKFCSNCGKEVLAKSNEKSLPIKQVKPSPNLSNIFQVETSVLTNANLPLFRSEGWHEGIFIGREDSKFYVNLPKGYDYNGDVRLQGTNSFAIKNEDGIFTIIGEEVPKLSGNKSLDDLYNFKDSVNAGLDKMFTGMKSWGLVNPKENLKLCVIEADDSWWYRATFSYKMSPAIYLKNSGYNLLGKTLVKIFASKSLKKDYLKGNKEYEEYKIMDFFYSEKPNQPFFALTYTFDEISSADWKKNIEVINEISKSLGYDG